MQCTSCYKFCGNVFEFRIVVNRMFAERVMRSMRRCSGGNYFRPWSLQGPDNWQLAAGNYQLPTGKLANWQLADWRVCAVLHVYA